MSEKTDEQKAAEAKAAADKKAADDKAAADQAEAKGKKVKVRVIADHGEHAINDTPSLSPDEAKAAEAAGWADSAPAAVKYAEGLKKAAATDEAE